MKRRNGDSCGGGKMRRPVKRGKLITDNIYGRCNSSTLLYLKFLVVWALVLLADFILEFRFEYLWPFWLLLRSVYDSFKYQGLAFSVFFICIALTSDMICLLFIPVHWLFFLASTYVWVQYVWYTERGICLPTVSLWLLFIYMEASVRLKEDFKSLPFHLDLCRPFAAHCIGYPMVTLGFGFKSYVGYRMRQRKQRDTAKDNDFFYQLLQQALPAELQQQHAAPASQPVTSSTSYVQQQQQADSINKTKALPSSKPTNEEVISSSNGTCGGGGGGKHKTNNIDNSKKLLNNVSVAGMVHDKHEFEYMETVLPPTKRNINDFEELAECESSGGVDLSTDKSFKASNGLTTTGSAASSTAAGSHHHHTTRGSKLHNLRENGSVNSSTPGGGNVAVQAGGDRGKKGRNEKNLYVCRDDFTIRLEEDMKRLRSDLQASRLSEQDLKCQLLQRDASIKNELNQLRADNESLQTKLHNLVRAKQQDKQTIGQLERQLQDEKKSRGQAEGQLASERKSKKQEEQAAARAVALAAANARSIGECGESCKAKRRELEMELKNARRDFKSKEDVCRQLERDIQVQMKVRQKGVQGETEILMSALSAMQDKNQHLENSLSAETRLKLDLFSALGDAKRRLEIAEGIGAHKDQEIRELKSKVAEVMAVMPSSYTACHNQSGSGGGGGQAVPPTTAERSSYSPVILEKGSAASCSPPVLTAADGRNASPATRMLMQHQDQDSVAAGGGSASKLDPNATIYIPKN